MPLDISFLHYSLPYCFQKLKHTGHVWLPLNRDYKPLGKCDGKFVNYDEHIATAIVFARDPVMFPNIWFGSEEPTSESNCLHLYYDNPKSREDYYKRLQRLFAHKHYLLGERDHQTRGRRYIKRDRYGFVRANLEMRRER